MSLSLTPEILKPFTYNNIFVETGSHTGGGIHVALYSGFRQVRSIEIDPNFYQACVNTYKDDSRVKLYLGDSAIMLYEMIEDIKEPITFFLDGHLAKGSTLASQEVPLLRELEHIKRHPVKTHTILIDDRRGFGWDKSVDPNLSEEWRNLTEGIIIEKLLEINPNYMIKTADTSNAPNDLLVAEY